MFGWALFVAALINLVEALGAHEALLAGRWYERVPIVNWTPERAIIASFSQFTIALIPLVWITLFASSRARWIVLAFGVLKLAGTLLSAGSQVISKAPEVVVLEAGLVALALVMLFLPATSRWLGMRRDHDVAAFA
ncbi:hypothetical protein [Erythrobacter sp. KY5]|uniref:hypothetical protein n=1 Tax=Erythrobacter sp. KY5 TaxID=2011159 RepID=UPI0013A6FED2|nr:hypothetical protein [Erythrobacter sp. KY5]